MAELMVEAAAQMDYPTSRGEVVQWFAEHYPQVRASTIRAHIVGLTANDMPLLLFPVSRSSLTPSILRSRLPTDRLPRPELLTAAFAPEEQRDSPDYRGA